MRGLAWIAGAAALVLVALWLIGLAAGSDPRRLPLAQSAMGHDGLVAWLNAQGIEARRLSAGTVRRDRVGVVVLPIHDDDLTRPFIPPAERERWLATVTERDLALPVVEQKRAAAPTWMILPKWSRAARLSGVAHDGLLAPLAAPERVARQLQVPVAGLIRPDAGLWRIETAEGAVLLFRPQLFPPGAPRGCRVLIGDGRGTLVLSCRNGVYVADPDLMNNHGLGLGDNARVVAALLRDAARGRPVLLDATTSVAIVPETAPAARDWADLGVFWRWPWGVVPMGAAVVLALLLWRGAFRTGPVRPDPSPAPPGHDAAIAATARLMRLAGHDAAVIRRRAEDRLALLGRRLTGQGGMAPPALLAAIGARDPDAAARLSAAVAALTARPDATSLAAFEAAVEGVLDGYRDAGRARRRAAR